MRPMEPMERLSDSASRRWLVRTLRRARLHRLADWIAPPRPDWYETDPSSPSYIVGRPTDPRIDPRRAEAERRSNAPHDPRA